jgi:replicative DNA helicase
MKDENLEKLYLHWIIKNPRFYKEIDDSYFKNDFIRTSFHSMKDFHKENPKTSNPSLEQLKHVIALDNRDAESEQISQLLTEDLSKYDLDWLETKFKTWTIYNRVGKGITSSIEEFRKIRNIDNLNTDEVLKFAVKVKDLTSDFSHISFNDNVGLDFDDPTSHMQNFAGDKITTGYENLNTILNGGWDRKTLNVIMGMTNSGKSLWLNNFAVNAVNAGYNVVYISLEMSDRKIMKRLGSIRLSIPINEYDKLSQDEIYMKKRINSVIRSGDGFVETPTGKLYVKEYPISSATPDDIDAYVGLLEDQKQIKIDLLVIDYLNIMSSKGGDGGDSLYSKGKYLAEGSRSIGQKRNLAVVTAVQTGKESWGSNKVNLSDTPESKAIPETADTQFAIIRTDTMKKENKYRLDTLKLRDGEFIESSYFRFNSKFLRIEGTEEIF